MADWEALGDRAIRFARPTGVSSRVLVDAVRAWDGVVDVVVARDDVAAYYDREPVVAAAQITALAALPADAASGRTIELHAIYDGPDLDDVARASALSVAAVIAAHAAASYVVETMGFAPGFAYLTGLGSPLAAVTRRATPRARVAAGSLAIAGGYTAVYPFDSPGGWNLIGRVEECMFGPTGALLRLGDRVRFVPR